MNAALLLAAALAAPACAETGAAGAVVRSKEWVIRRGEKREEEFVGDVRYEAAGNRMTADWALYKHAEKTWDARGKVSLRKVLERDGTVEARGERARFTERTGGGSLFPAPGAKVRFSRTPAEGGAADLGEAGRVEWESEAKVSLLDGARVTGPRVELAADRADYERAARRMTLTGGRPVLRKMDGEWTTAMKADTITATDSPRRIDAQGAVRGWLMFRDSEKLKETLPR